MPDLRKRAVTGILTLALTFTVVACDDSDDGPDTTQPGDSATTAPVGS